ncbi:MAG: hypothetical protein Q9181_002905 [Wetmoreana brouardii]
MTCPSEDQPDIALDVDEDFFLSFFAFDFDVGDGFVAFERSIGIRYATWTEPDVTAGPHTASERRAGRMKRVCTVGKEGGKPSIGRKIN